MFGKKEEKEVYFVDEISKKPFEVIEKMLVLFTALISICSITFNVMIYNILMNGYTKEEATTMWDASFKTSNKFVIYVAVASILIVIFLGLISDLIKVKNKNK